MRSPLAPLAVVLVLSACSSDDDSNVPGSGGAAGNSETAGTANGGRAANGGQAAMGARSGSATGGNAMGGRGGTPTTGGSGGEAGSEGGESGAGRAGGSATGECSAIGTFETGLMPSRELFVDPAASGTGNGSAGNPFSTLEAALSAATPGTAIRLRPGTHDGGAFASDVAGTASAPIWIGGIPGEARPVLAGGSNGLQLSRPAYVIVHDLEVSGQSSNGLNIDDGGDYENPVAHDLIFRNLSIRDIGSGGNQDCLKLSGVYDYVVLDSEFRGCSGGSAIDQVGCHRGLIARNAFIDLGGNGVQTKGGSDDIEITQNRFLNAGERAVNLGGSTGFEFFRPPLSETADNYEARNVRAVANVFRGGVSPVAFVGCVECVLANNTVVDPERWLIRILQETTTEGSYAFLPAQSGRIVNNIFYFSRADLSTYVNVGADTSPESFELSHNLWYAHDDPTRSQPSPLPAPETNGIYGLDPDFENAANDDYSIAPTSPAAGAGLTTLETPVADVEGSCYDAPRSIGAREAG